MRYKTFGKTGMEVSEICLGTWGMGGAGWDNYPKEQRIDAIAAAIESGINFIDTAPAYNAGAAERLLGEALETLGAREKVIISTKCGNEFINGQYVRMGHAKDIMRQCKESLENLRTDYIDLYLVHWPDPNVEFKETFEALNELKAAGKIRHIGVSNFSKEQIEEVMQYSEVEAFQPHYSMVYRDIEDLVKWTAEQNLGVMAYGALGGGILTGRYRQFQTFEAMDSRNRFYKHFHEPMFSRVQEFLKVMDQISESRDNVPLSQIALNWTAAKSYISSCVVGAQSRKRVEENAKAFDWQLTDAEIALLDQKIAELL